MLSLRIIWESTTDCSLIFILNLMMIIDNNNNRPRYEIFSSFAPKLLLSASCGSNGNIFQSYQVQLYYYYGYHKIPQTSNVAVNDKEENQNYYLLTKSSEY